jgi:hypothetical protein
MPLVDLKTSFKSLKFGEDRPYGGSSNQPYIQTSIPEGESSGLFQTGGPDFILRGGILAPIRAAKDVSRLTQMFFDLKSPNGLLFTAKQNVLSKTSVQTEATKGVNYALGINQGVYLPTSTIAQAGVGFIGTHLNLLGINPIDGLNKYETIVKANNASDITGNYKLSTPASSSVNPKLDPKINRLLQLWGNNQTNITQNTNLYSYSGGPDSVLGIGTTNIYISKQRTNVNTQFDRNWDSYNKALTTLKSFYYTPEQIASSSSLNLNSVIREDFRKVLIDSNDVSESTVLSVSPSYLSGDNKTIETRTHLGDPGKHLGNPAKFSKDVFNYSVKADELIALDKINALPMYDGEGPNSKYAINDLVKFRIAAINNDSENGRQAVYMHFRAFIDSFDDNYSATWNPIKYSGRGDTLYNYQGFERSINMSFTVYAQSKAELIPMYRKLNYLASTLAPDYTGAGFMRGNLLRLTLGGYLYEQPGFITSLTYTIPEESTWEIGIDGNGDSDNSVKELPHMIKVTGMTFTPIHNFLPQKPNSTIIQRTNDGNYKPIPEKYIALSAGDPSSIIYTNYGDYYTYYDAVNTKSPYDESAEAPVAQPLNVPQNTANNFTQDPGLNTIAPSSDTLNIPNSPNSFFR